MKNVEVSTTLAPVAMSTVHRWFLKVSTSGTRALVPASPPFLNDGVSSTFFRIHNPTTSRTVESRKGMRQPKDWNWSSLKAASEAMTAMLPRARAHHGAGLRHGAVEAAPVLLRVLDGQQQATAPLTAERHARQHAEQREQDGRSQTDGGVGGQHAHEHR